MATTVTLPALGESVTEGTVTQWLKEVGDTIEVDEPLLEISTDKVDTEIPSPVAGTLLEIRAAEDETIEVGAVLAVIGEEEESSGDADGSEPAATSAEPAGASAEDTEPETAQAEPDPVSQPTAEPASDKDDVQAADSEPEPQAAPQPQAASEKSPADEGPSGSVDITPVTLPALGESVTEGTVTQWLKEVGDTVEVDEPLLEISTDKVDTEIPSPVAGTLLEIKVAEDETVEVGAQLAVIGSDTGGGVGQESAQTPPTEEAPAADATPQAQPDPQAAPEPEPEPEPQRQAEPAPQPKVESEKPAVPAAEKPAQSTDAYITPIVRKLAKERGVDLAEVTGTGVGGRIRKQDVLDAAEKAPEPTTNQAPAAMPGNSAEPSPLRGRTEKLSRLRKTIAKRMHESLQNSAQLTTVVEADVTEIARIRDRHKKSFAEREGVKLSFLPFFAKAAVEALKVFPQVNSQLDLEAGTVTYPSGEHLGIAVDTEKGLIVPVIRDAGDLSIAGIARKIADVAERTRESKILPDELSGGTFTITNTGSRGALFDTPIINQPQVAILGTGAVVKRAVVVTDERGADSLAIRSMAYLALTYDHQIVDGADAARFLTWIKDRLENGNFESELGS